MQAVSEWNSRAARRRNTVQSEKGAAMTLGEARKTGFTLIELLVVVAIIALLISILLPSLSGAKRVARRVACGSNLRQIGLAMNAYANEEKEWIVGAPNGSGFTAMMGLSESQYAATGDVATTPWDWANPLAKRYMGSSEMSLNRFKRMAKSREGVFHCPGNFGAALIPYPSPPPKSASVAEDGMCPSGSTCASAIRLLATSSWTRTPAGASYGADMIPDGKRDFRLIISPGFHVSASTRARFF